MSAVSSHILAISILEQERKSLNDKYREILCRNHTLKSMKELNGNETLKQVQGMINELEQSIEVLHDEETR